MARSESRTIYGEAPPALAGDPKSELAYVDKRANFATTTIYSAGPDTLTLEPITFVSGGHGANAVYTLGTPVVVAPGASITVTLPHRMKSTGQTQIRIEDA